MREDERERELQRVSQQRVQQHTKRREGDVTPNPLTLQEKLQEK